MRKKFPEKVENGRVRHGRMSSRTGDPYGKFILIGPTHRELVIIANDANGYSDGWEHVSVSLGNRCPNWEEMCFVKKLFFEPNECVVQFHPPETSYVNFHPYCLHLFRHVSLTIPMPPSILVGPLMEQNDGKKSQGEAAKSAGED